MNKDIRVKYEINEKMTSVYINETRYFPEVTVECYAGYKYIEYKNQ